MKESIYLKLGQSVKSSSGKYYRYVQTLGTGGNAVTFLVLCTSGSGKGVLFALKVFRKLSKPERQKRFFQETQFLKGCTHPSIMAVYDDGIFHTKDSDFPFVVAEYLPETLHHAMRRASATIAEKLSYSLQLLSALSYLECQDPKTIHRDIKPANIFLKGRSCILGDFGLMKRLTADATDDLTFFNESLDSIPFVYRTPDLIAYAKGKGSLTVKTDVFQLALVLTELFTGRNPAKPPEHDSHEPLVLLPMRPIPGSLGSRLQKLLDKMLILDPIKRPTALDVIDNWQTYFARAVSAAHDLEGRVF